MPFVCGRIPTSSRSITTSKQRRFRRTADRVTRVGETSGVDSPSAPHLCSVLLSKSASLRAGGPRKAILLIAADAVDAVRTEGPVGPGDIIAVLARLA
jgi:hypothetical protein